MGVAMIAGGIRYKNQKFSKTSSGVGSVLLIMGIVGVFTPSLFYSYYGHHDYSCDICSEYLLKNSTTKLFPNSVNGSFALNCSKCRMAYPAVDLDTDSVYAELTRPLSWAIAAVLPFSYLVGML